MIPMLEKAIAQYRTFQLPIGLTENGFKCRQRNRSSSNPGRTYFLRGRVDHYGSVMECDAARTGSGKLTRAGQR